MVRASSEAVADLVVVLEQLYDDLDVGVVVLDGDDAQDVGRILRIRLLAVLVGEHQASVRLFHLHAHTHRQTSNDGIERSRAVGATWQIRLKLNDPTTGWRIGR